MANAASLPLPPASEHHLKVQTIPPRPEDVKSPEAIVQTDYECISGGIGVARQWARDFSLYDPNARSFVPYKAEKTGALVIWSPTQQEYADQADAHLVRDGFSEHEVAHKIYQYGNVATVFSSYEGTMASTGKLYSRGVNIYQLYFAQNRWWISSVSWDGENPIDSIPSRRLFRQAQLLSTNPFLPRHRSAWKAGAKNRRLSIEKDGTRQVAGNLARSW
jgi:hypothetical protein